MTSPAKSITASDTNALIYPGSVVLTSFGVAVVIHAINPYDDEDTAEGGHLNAAKIYSSFKARIWRQPGKSIASSNIAYLQNDCVSNYTQLYYFVGSKLRPHIFLSRLITLIF